MIPDGVPVGPPVPVTVVPTDRPPFGGLGSEVEFVRQVPRQGAHGDPAVLRGRWVGLRLGEKM